MAILLIGKVWKGISKGHISKNSGNMALTYTFLCLSNKEYSHQSFFPVNFQPNSGGQNPSGQGVIMIPLMDHVRGQNPSHGSGQGVRMIPLMDHVRGSE